MALNDEVGSVVVTNNLRYQNGARLPPSIR
jgi:hypothetical protein